jgi:deoxyribose-phosphate aldolase
MAFDIASYIDHTILKPDTKPVDIVQLCSEAVQFRFKAVCVPPYYVQQAHSILKDADIKVATVIGFPFGYSTIASKSQEMKDAIAAGADELDIVHNIAALKAQDWTYLKSDISACLQLAHDAGKTIKIIVESAILSNEELIRCCDIYGNLGIDFMKTSTGYAAQGATVHAVNIMCNHLPSHIRIKASGGIRNFAFAKELIDAGATRLGCSASVQILQEAQTTL